MVMHELLQSLKQIYAVLPQMSQMQRWPVKLSIASSTKQEIETCSQFLWHNVLSLLALLEEYDPPNQ